MEDFSLPDRLTDVDTGSVSYLLTLNHAGKIKHIEILNNSFNTTTEKLFRQAVRKSIFTRRRDSSALEIAHKGTLLITRDPCNDILR